MIEVLKNFEQAAGRLNPLVLIVPGLVMVATGLFVWLGGLGMRRTLSAVAGAVTGGMAAALIARQGAMIAVICAVVAAIIATVFQRLFTALLLGLLSLAIGFAILARPALQEDPGASIQGRDLGRGDQRLAMRDSLSVLRTYGVDLADAIRYAAGTLRPIQWVILAVVTAGSLAFAALLRSIGGAVAFAILGTALLFAGMILLLIFKGSMPVARMAGSGAFYSLVFSGMVAFGTVEQLVLCRRADRRSRTAKASKQQPDRAEPKRSWRNR